MHAVVAIQYTYWLPLPHSIEYVLDRNSEALTTAVIFILKIII